VALTGSNCQGRSAARPLGVTVMWRRQEDAALQGLRFRLVPRRVSEEQFWQRYFAAVASLRRKILGTGCSHFGGGGSGVSACGGGRAMSERSSSTAAGMSIVAGSSSSPGTPGASGSEIVGHQARAAAALHGSVDD
jgi:BSD domain